jgi:hypothetical protein
VGRILLLFLYFKTKIIIIIFGVLPTCTMYRNLGIFLKFCSKWALENVKKILLIFSIDFWLFMVFLSIVLYIQNGNDLQEDLANFGYRSNCESNCF